MVVYLQIISNGWNYSINFIYYLIKARTEICKDFITPCLEDPSLKLSANIGTRRFSLPDVSILTGQ